MTRTCILLFAAAIVCLASPAGAGAHRLGNPWAEPWTCSAFEFTHRCSALWHPRTSHCQCLGVEYLGRRLNEYYGPKAQYLAPRDVSQ
jgi:hypothetical protein